MKTAIVYHRVDCDGVFSYAVARSFELMKPSDEVLPVPWTYGDPLPRFDDILKCDRLVMVDVAFPPKTMRELKAYFGIGAFTWIDHHATAISDARENGYDDLDGIREMGRGAVELTWRHYYPAESVPRFVSLLGAYDVWDRSREGLDWETETLPFQWGVREAYDLDAEAVLRDYGSFVHDPSFIAAILADGRKILSYARKTGANGVETYGFPVSIGIDERPGICCLTSTFGGLAFERVLTRCPGAVAVCVNRIEPKSRCAKETYKLSIYAGAVKPGWHIGEYLKEHYGGGGHEGAGGAVISREASIRLVTRRRL